MPVAESRSATKHAPGSSARESFVKESNIVSGSPAMTSPDVASATSRAVRRIAAPPAPRARPCGRRTATRHAGRGLALLMALARDEHDVAGRAIASASRIAARRSSCTTSRWSGTPATTSAAIAAASSERGLSDVSTARSAARVAAPIFGRFSRSRSPPHPNTTITRPSGAAIERGRGERLLERLGCVGVVDEHLEPTVVVDPLHPSGNDQRRGEPGDDRVERDLRP